MGHRPIRANERDHIASLLKQHPREKVAEITGRKLSTIHKLARVVS